MWHSLTSRHAHLALGEGNARRYPREIAPFAGIPDASEQSIRELLELVQVPERIGILNVHPGSWEGWDIQKSFDIAQYVWDQSPGSLEPDPEAEPLNAAHLPQMLELTALVYPAYFRQGTAELGDYFGFIQDGKLWAMAGIRMAFEGHQEISAVCTHPDHRGKGYASRLTRHLIHHIENQGDAAFLHTESDNISARRIYDFLGFSLRAMLPFFVVERVPD
ncbi:MAG: GNAT family N-acetyltransferase [Chlorobia bacterium]|nr:GNAT family N-acetyltransferase [Fimbriimonadaceae bacterium]